MGDDCVYVGPMAAVSFYLKLVPEKLKPIVDDLFDFSDARKAHEKPLSRQFFGKIVVRV